VTFVDGTRIAETPQRRQMMVISLFKNISFQPLPESVPCEAVIAEVVREEMVS